MSKIETSVIKPEIKFTENEVENIILTKDFEIKLDSKIDEISSYMANNGKETGIDKSQSEVNELYENAKEMHREYVTILREIKYNFFLNQDQYKFLTNLIVSKLEYDVNTVFLAIELTNLMGSMKEGANFRSATDLIEFKVDATEITYIYHLISTFKIKGLTKDSYTFAQVLRRIGDISKVFNYYNTYNENLAGDIQKWIFSLDDKNTVEVEEEDKVSN